MLIRRWGFDDFWWDPSEVRGLWCAAWLITSMTSLSLSLSLSLVLSLSIRSGISRDKSLAVDEFYIKEVKSICF